MAQWRAATAQNMQVRRLSMFPVTSDEYVYPTVGRACLRQSMKLRCIPCVGARHSRHICGECMRRYSVLWPYCVVLGWITREIYIEIGPRTLLDWPT